MTRDKPTSLSLKLGARIAELRSARGWTRVELEANAGFHAGYISRVERGLIQPELKALAAIAGVFGITLSRLFRDIDGDDNSK
jgi:transcriptional regulator with XRE-family HTH domain